MYQNINNIPQRTVESTAILCIAKGKPDCGTLLNNMTKLMDLTGQRFERLIALRRVYIKKGITHWECLCDCGNKKNIKAQSLLLGVTRSCGCLLVDINRAKLTTHNLSLTSEYRTWAEMKYRCSNIKNKEYKYYGGRGITVCDRWLQSFENFLADMGERPTPQHSIDRIDNNGNYEPSNCRWATHLEQCRNQRTNINLSYSGRTQCLEAWANELNISCARLKRQLNVRQLSEIVKNGAWKPHENRICTKRGKRLKTKIDNMEIKKQIHGNNKPSQSLAHH